MTLQTWLLFLAATAGLSFSPGPNGLLALTHGAVYGRARAVFTILGGVLGFLLLMMLSMFGVGALLQSSVTALTALQWLGGAYLVWLGIQQWRAPGLRLNPNGGSSHNNVMLFRQGALAALSNPKVLIFFAAFLPQFVDPQRPLSGQFATMALTFAVIEFSVEAMLALSAHHIGPKLQTHGERFNRFCGGLFILIGLALPLSR
ncbi:putative threonine efflux protein [Hahella chejuensis KCTC 2396]|uniref:Putative threonine efflux protein n=1 Tax=Hahella chejuensis (strain KCTC 2396) TaxID=349521 RepID=Q2SQT5_HAHCH|nr:LysE family translocator [Hahella chejuensis]ABC26989.1 putative threonine efflux protein [Hahella chejuensis KCTC 2396]